MLVPSASTTKNPAKSGDPRRVAIVTAAAMDRRDDRPPACRARHARGQSRPGAAARRHAGGLPSGGTVDEAATLPPWRPSLQEPGRLARQQCGIALPATLEDTTWTIPACDAVNLRAAILRPAVLPGMRAAGHGRIVNITSRAALGKELRTAYSAAKAGLIG